MIEHGEGFSVQVETPDLFFLIDKGRNSFVSMNRAELTHYRALIDQALNTSVEELCCSKNERLGALANPDTFGKPTFGVKSAEGMGDA